MGMAGAGGERVPSPWPRASSPGPDGQSSQ